MLTNLLKLTAGRIEMGEAKFSEIMGSFWIFASGVSRSKGSASTGAGIVVFTF